MGAFDKLNDTLEVHSDKWDAHESATVRLKVNVGDEEWVNNRVLKMKQGKKGKNLDFQSQLGATKRLWLERMIVSWTFTQDGHPVEVSSAAITALPSTYADFIYDAINDENEDEELEDEEDEENFSHDSSKDTEEFPPQEQPELTVKKSRNYLKK